MLSNKMVAAPKKNEITFRLYPEEEQIQDDQVRAEENSF
jgi:hypothetical protein